MEKCIHTSILLTKCIHPIDTDAGIMSAVIIVLYTLIQKTSPTMTSSNKQLRQQDKDDNNPLQT